MEEKSTLFEKVTNAFFFIIAFCWFFGIPTLVVGFIISLMDKKYFEGESSPGFGLFLFWCLLVSAMFKVVDWIVRFFSSQQKGASKGA